MPDYRLLRCAVLFAAAACSFAQGTTTRAKAADYPVHVQAAGLELAAEYLVHSLPTSRGVFFVNDYLVIEVAAFPISKTSSAISAQNLTLRINGRKTALLTQAPGMVAASLKYPDWEQPRSVTAQAGLGDTGVILGRPRATERFPGDPTPQQGRLPAPPRVPDDTRPSAAEREPEVPIDKLCQSLALPEGAFEGPVSGYVFFPFRGKTKSIHSLELVLETPAGATSLSLF